MIEFGGSEGNVLFHSDARGGGILEFVEFGHIDADIVEELVGHVAAESLLAEHTHHNDILDIRGHCVGGHHPSALGELVLKVEESPLGGFLIVGLHHPDEDRIGGLLRIVDKLRELGDFGVQVAAYAHRVGLYCLVALESETDELIVLAENLGCRTREVEADLTDFGTEIVDRETHVGGQILLVAPNHPSEARINEAELMA